MLRKNKKQKKNFISIVIPTQNSSKTLKQLLKSIFKSNYKSFEVIIIDDASTDNTVGIAEKFDIRLIKLINPKGPAFARNKGVAIAKGKIILFLDSDIIIQTDTLTKFIKSFKENPDARAIVGLYSFKSLNPGIFYSYKAFWDGYCDWIQRNDKEYTAGFKTSCGAVLKDFFNKSGKFNEAYQGSDVEDFEFGYRIQKKTKIVLNPEIVVYHYPSSFINSIKKNFKRGKMWLILCFKIRKFKNSSCDKYEIFKILFSIFSFIFVLMSFWKTSLLLFSIVLFVIYILFNFKFLKYIYSNKPFYHIPIYIYFHYIHSIILFFAGLSAAFKISGIILNQIIFGLVDKKN